MFIQHVPLVVDECRARAYSHGVALSRDRAFQIAYQNAIQGGDKIVANLLSSEHHWCKQRRPFFNVYPSIQSALLRTSLSVSPSQIPKSVCHDLGVICVKFGRPIGTFRSAFLNLVGEGVMGVNWKGAGNSVFNQAVDWETRFSDTDAGNLKGDELDEAFAIVRVCIGVSLLAADPEYIEPIPLAKDRSRVLSSEEVERRAHNRGLVGYDIGKRVECSPHIRRPHFGIRWTGHGRRVPKLVPIKGSVIHKKALTSVPTGFEG